MSKNQYFRAASNLCIALAFISALLLILGKTYGHDQLAQNVFFVSGGAGIILNIYISLVIEKNKDFNWIFWLGTIVIFGSIISKLLHWPNYQIILFIGAGITGLSYFINPFAKKGTDEETDNLLDQ